MQKTKKIFGISFIAIILLSAVLITTYFGQSSAEAKPKVTIAIQPTAQAEEMMTNAQELKAFLEARTGTEVEIFIPTSYSAVVNALKYGHAQIGLMGAWPLHFASTLAGADVPLAEVREVMIGDEKTEKNYYYSYYVVPKDSEYTSLSQLQGKRVAYTSLISSSGYLFPVARLVELGYISEPEAGKEADPKQFFSQVYMAGGYSQAWEALKQGQVDVAVIAGDVSEALYNEVLSYTRIVETQGPVPSHGVAFSKDFEEPLRTKFINAFLELNNPEYRLFMRKFISGIFVGFQQTTVTEHIGALSSALEKTGYKFTERL